MSLITTGELYAEFQRMNQHLEEIEARLTGSIKEIELANNTLVESGSAFESVTVNPDGARYALVAIGINVKNWFARTNASPIAAARQNNTLYPFEVTENTGVGKEYLNARPYMCVPVIYIDNESLRDDIKTINDAITIANKAPFKVSVWNNDESDARLYVRVFLIS